MLLFLPALGFASLQFALPGGSLLAVLSLCSSAAQESLPLVPMSRDNQVFSKCHFDGAGVQGGFASTGEIFLCAGNRPGPSSIVPTPAQKQLPDKSLVSPAHSFLASKWAVSTHLADCTAKRLGFQL